MVRFTICYYSGGSELAFFFHNHHRRLFLFNCSFDYLDENCVHFQVIIKLVYRGNSSNVSLENYRDIFFYIRYINHPIYLGVNAKVSLDTVLFGVIFFYTKKSVIFA